MNLPRPEQLAEAAPTPVRTRLASALRDLANIVENQTDEVMADPEVDAEAKRLHAALGDKVTSLGDEMQRLAALVERSPLAVIASDGVFQAAQSLHYWLAAMVPAAERQREIDGKPVERPSVVLLDDPPEG